MVYSSLYYDPELPVSMESETAVEETAASAEPETVAAELGDIEAEPGVNALGESVSEASSLDYFAIANEAIEREQLASLEAKYETELETIVLETEESTLSLEERLDSSPTLAAINEVSLRAASSITMPEEKAYQLTLDNRDVYAWFPDGVRLVVTDDGHIYNESNSNITGIIADSLTGVDLNSYNDTVTITPALTGSGNNNAYRYGSRVYVTDYYASSSYLSSSVTYINDATCSKEPGAGYGFSNYQLCVFGILFAMLLVLILRFVRK